MADYVDPAAEFAGASSDADERARELEAQIAQVSAEPVVQDFIEADEEPADDEAPQTQYPSGNVPTVVRRDRPIPEAQLTPEQKRIRQLEDQLARAQARKLESDNAAEFEAPGEGDLIEFYVLRDGWTAFGQVWYRGQEFALTVGSRAWDETLDRNGVSFLRYLDDEFAQMQVYGEVYIRKGRWPGKPYGDPRAAAAEQRRNRAVPLLRV